MRLPLLPERSVESALILMWLVVVGLCPWNVGCRRPQISPEAKSWPAVAEDPREKEGEPGTWPMFRGPNAQGIGVEAHPPVAFGEDHNLRWRVAVPGSGNSSPVVWHDRIFLTTAEGGRSDANGVVLAYRRSDGALLWRYEVGLSKVGRIPKTAMPRQVWHAMVSAWWPFSARRDWSVLISMAISFGEKT